jgi:hypothetical protein
MGKLRGTCLTFVGGIPNAHVGGFVSQRHDQIKKSLSGILLSEIANDAMLIKGKT